VAMITGTAGPRSTRIPVGADAGLKRYDESYVDVMSLHTVPLDRVQRRRGRTSATELLAVETALRLVLGL